jgi:hypothetical protein
VGAAAAGAVLLALIALLIARRRRGAVKTEPVVRQPNPFYELGTDADTYDSITPVARFQNAGGTNAANSVYSHLGPRGVGSSETASTDTGLHRIPVSRSLSFTQSRSNSGAARSISKYSSPTTHNFPNTDEEEDIDVDSELSSPYRQHHFLTHSSLPLTDTYASPTAATATPPPPPRGFALTFSESLDDEGMVLNPLYATGHTGAAPTVSDQSV